MGEYWLKIVELKDGMRRVDVEGTILEKGEPRTVNLRAGGQATVVECKIGDDSGSIKLSLWDDLIDKVNVGDRVKIENGYVSSFRGELRLNVGRYGRLYITS